MLQSRWVQAALLPISVLTKSVRPAPCDCTGSWIESSSTCGTGSSHYQAQNKSRDRCSCCVPPVQRSHPAPAVLLCSGFTLSSIWLWQFAPEIFLAHQCTSKAKSRFHIAFIEYNLSELKDIWKFSSGKSIDCFFHHLCIKAFFPTCSPQIAFSLN